MLTHNVKNTNISESITKTKFDRFKDYVKKKAMLVAFPVVLTFAVPTYAQELTINYEHENVDKEVEVKVTKKMKEIYINYENKKIDETKLKAQLFREVYAQLKNDKEFPVTKLSDVVNELTFELSEMDLKPKKVKKKITPKVNEEKKEEGISQEEKDNLTKTIEEKSIEHTIPKGKEQEFVENFSKNLNKLEEIAREFSQEKTINSTYLYENIDTLEYDVNNRLMKLNTAVEQLLSQVEMNQVEIITIDEPKIEAKKSEGGIKIIANTLNNEINILEKEVKEKTEILMSEIDLCETCTDKVALKNIILDMNSEISNKKIAYNNMLNKHLETENTFEKYKKEMEKVTEIAVEKYEKEKEKKTKWKFTIDGDALVQKNSVPSLEDNGISNSILSSNLGIKLITKSGFGIEFIGGYSGEIVYLTDEIKETRDSDSITSKTYSADNHLGKMLLGLSYNNEDISIALMGGYKLGKLNADNKLNRDEYYPIVTFNLESSNKNYTKLKVEVPVLFNEGQNLLGTFDHSSKYIVTSLNAQYSRQSTIERTDNDNVLRNIYQILNSQNFLGVNLYNFKVQDGFVAPTLFLVGNVNYLNAEGLQTITNWSLGPGLGLNYIYKDNPILSLGYGYGMGKSKVSFTDLEGQNSYILRSPYSTHNMFIRLNAPISERINLGSEFMYVKGDGKGKEGIESTMADYMKFLIMFNYNY